MNCSKRTCGFLWLWLFLIFTATPALVLADEWDEFYQLGKQAIDNGEWDAAISNLQNALQRNNQPDDQAATSNLKLVAYLPYFYLGEAFFFKGDYAEALSNFQKSMNAGAILKTKHTAQLRRFKQLSQQLLEREKRPDVESKLKILENAISQGNFKEATRILQRVQQQNPGDVRFPVYAKWLHQEQQRRQEAGKASKSDLGKDLDRRFKRGLDFYLLGQYQEALNAFTEIAAVNPNFNSAQNWVQKIRTDIERLRLNEEDNRSGNQPEPIIVERTITQSSAPLFAMRSPAETFMETRMKTMTFSGQVGDDRGIDFIEFTVNGKLLATKSGEKVQVKPGVGDDPKRFTFNYKIPLWLGENQITLTAYDVDSLQKRSTEQFNILRKPPIYQTAGFLITSGAVILLFIGGVFITKVVKYKIAIVNKYNPYIAGLPIRNREMFFGREQLMHRILNTIHNNSLMIHGPRRIGKTSLQHQIKQRLEETNDPEYAFIPVFIDLQGTSEQLFFATMMEEILESCKNRLPGQNQFRIQGGKASYSARDFSGDLRKALQILSAQTDKQVKLVLHIDEVDELNKYSEQVNQKLRSVFMKTFAENLVAIMSGSTIKKNWQSEGSPWYNFFEEIAVPPLQPDDARQLIRKPVTGIFYYDDAAVEKIVAYSEGKPYIIQRFCINVINRIIEQKRRKVTVADVEAVKPQVLTNSELKRH